ncbi:alcohol dehydrogenase catalytic domain-containing protein [Enterococcus gallinarum]|uniref:alcohol dehydrogenase catalytic domain-containing protein n=1 Tax=Enterococcus gallinarum TaxID=1353 RepID=UPI002434021D|nr:zinc-binding dehydrogenase [Enterococcus gallinarum]
MKAAVIKHIGSPEKIEIVTLPDPKISPNEVLIEVCGVAVNHVDTFIRSGSYQTPIPLPFIIGRDAVGKVIDAGEKTSKFKVGEWVWTNSMGYGGRQGITSTLAAIPEERLFRVPENCDPLQLVASVHSAATAAILLKDVLNLSGERTLLIEGGAGHLGKKLIQIACDLGAHVLTTSHPDSFGGLRSLGTQECYSYHTDDLVQLIHQKHPQGVDFVIDTSGQVSLQTNLDCLSVNGVLGLITAPIQPAAFSVQSFYTQNKQIKGFVISLATISQLQSAGEQINRYFGQGKLLENNILIKHCSDASWAHSILERNEEKRKIVLIPVDEQ